MSARSGVFTKYVIDFVDAKFKVSNDVSAISAGDFLLDADVTVTMARDTAGTTFTITLYNLPQNQLDALDAAINPKNYQQSVKIQLGYFETKALQVVDGIYDKIESKVAADSTTGQNRLVTTISGKEKALRAGDGCDQPVLPGGAVGRHFALDLFVDAIDHQLGVCLKIAELDLD